MPTVSWGAIFAGAFSATALSFVLLAIGAAFGLSVASPWDFTGREANGAAAPSTAPGTGGAVALPLAPTSDTRSRREEVGRVLHVAFDGDLSPEDKTYLTQLVAQETGMSQPDAERRVTQVIEKAKATKAEAEQKAKEAADAARKAGMYTALWAAVAMLAGAFSAAPRGEDAHGMPNCASVRIMQSKGA